MAVPSYWVTPVTVAVKQMSMDDTYLPVLVPAPVPVPVPVPVPAPVPVLPAPVLALVPVPASGSFNFLDSSGDPGEPSQYLGYHFPQNLGHLQGSSCPCPAQPKANVVFAHLQFPSMSPAHVQPLGSESQTSSR